MATKKKQQPLSTTNLLILLVLVSLLVIGGTALGAKSLITSIIRDTKVFSAKDKAIHQLDRNLDAAPKLVSNYKDLGDTQALIAHSLPNTSDYPGFIALMESLSSGAGVTLKSVSPSQVAAASAPGTVATGTASAGPQTLNLTVTLDGSQANLTKLLENIEQSARPLRVTGMALSGSASNLSIQFEITTYYQDKAGFPFKLEDLK